MTDRDLRALEARIENLERRVARLDKGQSDAPNWGTPTVISMADLHNRLVARGVLKKGKTVDTSIKERTL